MSKTTEINPKYIGWGDPWIRTFVDADIIRQLATTNDDLLSLRMYDLVNNAHLSAHMNKKIGSIIVMDTISNLDMLLVDETLKPKVGFSVERGVPNNAVLVTATANEAEEMTGRVKWSDLHEEVLKGGESLAQKTRLKYSRFNQTTTSSDRKPTQMDFVDIVDAVQKMGVNAVITMDDFKNIRFTI